MKIQLFAISIAVGCLLSVPISAFAQAFNFGGAETRALERYYDGSPAYNGTQAYWDYDAPNSSQAPYRKRMGMVHRRDTWR
jgi:hypothetical protein